MNPKFKGNSSKMPLKASRVIEDKEYEEWQKTPRGKLSYLKISLDSIKKHYIPLLNHKKNPIAEGITKYANDELEELIKLIESLEKELDK